MGRGRAGAEEWAEPFTCQDECGNEASLYEELGVDEGASDKETPRRRKR